MYITLANSNGAYISILQIQLSQQNSGNQGTRDLAGGYLLRCFFWYGMWLSAPFASGLDRLLSNAVDRCRVLDSLPNFLSRRASFSYLDDYLLSTDSARWRGDRYESQDLHLPS
jgi:hypothetical protein